MAKKGFDVTAAAYPEPHPDSRGKKADFEYLKQKFDADANRAITQFFFEKDKFLRFRDETLKHGISKPIIPGILPIENFEKVRNFANKCGASLLNWLGNAFTNCDDKTEQHILAVSVAFDLIQNLQSEGVKQFHIYTMNNPELVSDICIALGLQRKALTHLAIA